MIREPWSEAGGEDGTITARRCLCVAMKTLKAGVCEVVPDGLYIVISRSWVATASGVPMHREPTAPFVHLAAVARFAVR
jgi:hypothetical protein